MDEEPTPTEDGALDESKGADARHDVVWNRWDEVDELLDRVLDVPVGEREAFLAAACPDDPELVEAVLGLAREEAGPDASFGPGSEVLRAALLEEGGVEVEDPGDQVGTVAGAYRLTSVVGTGGMGSVYAAERADGTFDRTVAVKVLRSSMATAEVVRRFEVERQILASLSHPNIAQLIDGGVTEDGRPYFVMELVEGVRIDEWADRNRLDVEARLRLLLKVMDAVEHAHRHLVVHRDLKPSNILVRDDGAVKLLDFGIARLLDEPTGEAAATRTGHRFLTPEYAAPEQLLGESASTQTDVYSIAILAYELLTGTRPYETEGSASILEQVVGGAEPTAPSAALPPANTRGAPAGSESVGPDAVYTARSTTPDGLRRSLRGDIDAVLMRALRARPSERYSTVAAFRDDVERHLDGRAVEARGDARGYRVRKFVGRHRIAVGAAAGTFLLVSGSALGLAFQRSNLIEQRRLAEEASAEAALEAETARATTAFLTSLFQSNDPAPELADTLTARALLERGVERIEGELSGQPAVRAELLSTLGGVHGRLGLQEDGIALQERAISLIRDSVPGARGLGRALLQLAYEHVVRHDYELATPLFAEAYESALSQGDSVSAARARIGNGRVLSMLDRPEDAEVELREGLAMLDSIGSDPDDWTPQLTLAGIVRRRGDLAGADSLLSDLEARMRVEGADGGAAFLTVLNDLAVVRRLSERYGEAVALYEELLDSADVRLGRGHPTTLMYRGNLANALQTAGRSEDAVAVHLTSLEAMREQWPEGHWRIADLLMNIGATLVSAGLAEEALPYLGQAIDEGIEHIGRYHAWTNTYRGWAGVAAALSGRRPEAEQFFAWSLEGLTQYEGLSEDRLVLARIQALVRVMREQGLHDEAAPFAALLSEDSGTP